MRKICMLCEHFEPDTWTCSRPIGSISPVTGEDATLRKDAEAERADPTGCGPNGLYFVAFA